MKHHAMTRAAMLASSSAAMLAGAGLPLPARAQTPPPLRVGSGLIEAQAEAHYAFDQGIFKTHGLDVDVQTNNNGAANSAAVASGDLQIAATSTISVAQAFNRGLPFVIIVPGGIHDSRYPGSGAFVAPDSKIQSPKDLNGKTIAVATAKGLDQLLASALVDKHGGDSSTLKFVEFKPVTMVDALLANRIDAAYIDDPEYSLAKARARLIGDGEQAVGDVFVESVWFTTKDWLAKNPDAARRFRDAIYDAGDWAMANPDRAGLLLQQDLKVTQTRGTQRFATRANTNLASYQILLDAAAKYSLIPPTKATDLLWQGR